MTARKAWRDDRANWSAGLRAAVPVMPARWDEYGLPLDDWDCPCWADRDYDGMHGTRDPIVHVVRVAHVLLDAQGGGSRYETGMPPVPWVRRRVPGEWT